MESQAVTPEVDFLIPDLQKSKSGKVEKIVDHPSRFIKYFLLTLRSQKPFFISLNHSER